MKKVVKVSIGNLAFTLEEDGFLILKSYLQEVEEFYGTGENGAEIVEGIEERIAELFLERSLPGSVVSFELVKEVVTVLGRPWVEEEQPNERAKEESSHKTFAKNKQAKKLYRDTQNRILGGVCSGLATYFSVDPILFRLLFVILFFGFSIFGFLNIGGASITLFGYLFLWIVLPAAKTIEQKYAMHGNKVDISNIFERVEQEISSVEKGYRGSRVANLIGTIIRIFSFVIASLFIMISIVLITTLMLLLLGVEIFSGLSPINLIDYVQLGVANTLWLKISILLFLLIPLLALLYVGLKMVFGFKPSKIKLGLIMLLLWIGSIIGLGYFATRSTRPYWSNNIEENYIPLGSPADTLYIDFGNNDRLPDDRTYLDAGDSWVNLFWMEGESSALKAVLFPKVKIVRESSESEHRVEYKTIAFGKNYAESFRKARERRAMVTIEDSVVTIKPQYIDKENKWDGTLQEILIFVDNETEVIMRKPFRHEFDKRVKKKWYYWGRR